MKEYYDLRAPYYDDWWIGAARDRARLAARSSRRRIAAVTSLPPARTLDVACGTGYLTAAPRRRGRRARPEREHARRGAPPTARTASSCRATHSSLPFPDGAFERIFTSYFYCHLVEDERVRFLAEARRVAPELVVLGSRPGDDDEAWERWEERPLKDGSTWPVFKRVFDPDALAAELGGDVLHAGRWFVVVRTA